MPKRFWSFALPLLMAAGLIIAACGQPATPAPVLPTSQAPTPTPKITSRTTGEIGSLAPELAGITGWINTEPFSLASLRGQVVLIDFWTYTCVNCIRTFPYLKEWYEKYTDRGLNIVGVHSPEFEFEKNKTNVEEAVRRHGLKWPIAQDNDMATWRAFNNRFWPAKYLLDGQGIIRYRHFGEGAYDEVERWIRDLLGEIGVDVSSISPGTDPGPVLMEEARSDDSRVAQTRELYAGLERNQSASIPYYGNIQYYHVPPLTPAFYEDPGDHNNHFLYLHGAWTTDVEDIKHARATQNLEDYIALKFFATSVNAVMELQSTESFDVVITLDEAPVDMASWGSDLHLNGEGMTVVTVNEARMYNLLHLPAYGGHELKLSSNSPDFNLFAFTFGSYSQDP